MRSELFREFLASALYVSLVIFGGLAVVPEAWLPTDRDVVLAILATTVGLLLPHWVSFTLASEVVSEGARFWTLHSAEEGLSQLAGGAATASMASVAFLLFDGDQARDAALFLLALVPASAGLSLGRQRGRSWAFSAAVASVVLAVSFAAAGVKVLSSK